MEPTLGKKILFFRKRSGLSQFALESEIEAAPGTISRIENNEVNPLKETVLKIANVLNLSTEEVDYLIGITAFPATSEAIEKAKVESSNELEKVGKLSYLLDERWRLHKFSNDFLKFLSLDSKELEYMIGKTTTQLIVKSDSPLLERLDQNHYENLLKGYLPIYYSNMSYMSHDESYITTIKDIMGNNIAKKVWSDLSNSGDRTFTPEESRIIHFNIKGTKLPLYYSIQPLLVNSRFVIVEYHTENKVPEILSGLI